MASRRSRNWCFTINNPRDEILDCEDCALTNSQNEAVVCGHRNPDDPQTWADVRYLVWQLEQGTEGTPHLQGYVVWAHARSLSWVKRQCPRAHWEIAIGDFKANYKYCTKEEGRQAGPWERGVKPRPGKRSDLTDIAAMIDKGKPMSKVARSYPGSFMRYHGGIYKYRQETYPVRHGEPNIIILWGPTGCGKSKLVYEIFPDAYRKPKGKWWDGYHTQQTVVFDDFYSWISYDELLRILDWYPLLVQPKNSYIPIRATTFVFTSNQDPMDWYRGAHPVRGTSIDTSALHRRIRDFGLVLRWSDVGRVNRSGTMTYHKDWVIDKRWRE